jgi:hypothetical protein
LPQYANAAGQSAQVVGHNAIVTYGGAAPKANGWGRR